MKKITAIILLFLVAACAQDPGDLQETTHKNMDKLIAEGTVCENGTVRDISCGTGDQGTQHQKCESGVWVDVGGCEYCENDDVRTIPCGTDNTGGQRQKCVEAVWVDVGGCEYCEDGDTRVVPCGTENKGEQQQECVAGVWTDTSTCEYCTNGDERTIKCGLNGRGEKPQKCVEGAWADDGDCIDPDECLDDDTRDLEKGCGLNGQGTQPQICVEGKWENTGTCTDKVSDPEFSSPSGTYQTTQNIVLSSQTAGTTIRYTINGDEPTVASLVYTAPIEIPSNQTSETLRTIKAKAYKTGYTESDIVEANYTITGTAATPQYNVLPGAYNTNKMVTITTGTTGASIRYTINGDDPTDEIGTPYTEPVEITATTTLKAVAYKTNWVNSAVQSVTYTLKMADPAFSVPAGTYATTQNIELSTISPNAEIRYTTNGDEPTETSTLYTGAISLPTNQTDEMTTTIKAKVFSTEFGWEDSGIVERTYRITGTVATPVLSPDEGTYTTSQSVTITCATTGATIRYTTNGSEPTGASAEYTGAAIPLEDGAITTVKAKAFLADWVNSTTASAQYTIDNIPAPVITPDGGVFDAPVENVTITTPINGVTIRYTLDGTDPTGASTAYTAPMTFAVSRHLVAKVFKSGLTTSNTSEKRYIVGGSSFCDLIATPSLGTYNAPQNVSLSCATEGSVIRYEMNDPEPDMFSNLYSTPIEVAETSTIKAIAYKLGVAGYAKNSPAYTIDEGLEQVATPTFDPVGGDYYGASLEVTIATTTSEALIRYTLDGSEPSFWHGYEYAASITIPAGYTTIKAKAFKSGMADSAMSTANYRLINSSCTGQTKCYNNSGEMACPTEGNDFYGQDAQYAALGMCVPKSYTVSGTSPNDIVTDDNTGLQWQRTANTTVYTWANAITYCENLNYGGYTDWRLPNDRELESIVDYGRYNPAIDTDAFPSTPSSFFWSSSSHVSNTGNAWLVNFGNGSVYDSSKSDNLHARCVR